MSESVKWELLCTTAKVPDAPPRAEIFCYRVDMREILAGWSREVVMIDGRPMEIISSINTHGQT